MRASSHIGEPQENIRKIAFEMETASNGMEENGDAATTTTNDNLNEDVFEKGSNRTMTKEDRLLFGGSLLPVCHRGHKLDQFSSKSLILCSYTSTPVTTSFCSFISFTYFSNPPPPSSL